MRNPRSTTFNLTSIQSQRGSPRSTRKYSPRHEKTKALGAAPDQESRLRNLVNEYKIKNQNLSEFIQHFENSSTDLNERDNLIKDLQVVLIKHTSSLERRMKRISDIEKQVSIFRKVSNEEEELDKQFPIKLPDESYRTHSARNNRRRMDFLPQPKYQKPKRRIFPPPKIEKTQDTSSTNPLTPLTGTSNLSNINSDFNQSNLKKEREKLTQKTLYLDRLISIEKLKLKLFHDHRTLSELKSELDIMQSEPVNYHRLEVNEEEAENDQSYENDDDILDNDETDLVELKNSINLIKERIQDEKKRISFLENKYYPIHDAAIDIQRIWRGFLAKKHQKKEEADNENQDNVNEEEDQKNEIVSNSENLNENANTEEENINEIVVNEENLNENANAEEENTNEENLDPNANAEEETLNEKVENEENLDPNANAEEALNEKANNIENQNDESIEKVDANENLATEEEEPNENKSDQQN